MTYDGFVPPDHVKLLADVLHEYCKSTNRAFTKEDREMLALRLLSMYRSGLETREDLLSRLEVEPGVSGEPLRVGPA